MQKCCIVPNTLPISKVGKIYYFPSFAAQRQAPSIQFQLLRDSSLPWSMLHLHCKHSCAETSLNSLISFMVPLTKNKDVLN